MISIDNGPLVSICIPSYNASATIRDTLNSVINQTYRNLEIIVSDNASVDSTVNIVEEFTRRDKRIRLSANAENIGGEENFTRSMHLGKGEYTAIFHADDVYHERIVEKEVDYLLHNDVAAVFTAGYIIDGADKHIGKTGYLPSEIFKPYCEYSLAQILPLLLKYGNLFICPSAIVKTEVYKEYLKKWSFRDFDTSSDLGVWIRIMEKYSIGHINEPLIYYRDSESSYSHRIKTTRLVLADMFRVLDYYISKYNHLITNQDFNNYSFLKSNDILIVARNLLLKGDQMLARKELSKINIGAIFACKNIFRIVRFFWKYFSILLFSIILNGASYYRIYFMLANYLEKKTDDRMYHVKRLLKGL